MELYLVGNLNNQISRYSVRLLPQPAEPPTNLRRRRNQNARRQSDSVMLLNHVALQRIAATPYFGFKRSGPKLFLFNVAAMADRSTTTDLPSKAIELNDVGKDDVKEEKPKPSANSTPSVPPPPEKPLPDDCCGSGCVRCVWDVYYEELDEYERLYKTDYKS